MSLAALREPAYVRSKFQATGTSHEEKEQKR